MRKAGSLRRTLASVPGARAAAAMARSATVLVREGPEFAQHISGFEATELPDPPNDCGFLDLFLKHEGRYVHKWLHYGAIYDRLLAPVRSGFRTPSGERRPLLFLEIGVSHGGSLELWRDYLGPVAVIFGIDIDPRCETVGREDLQVRIGSQADGGFLRDVVAEMGGLDVVIDDGSHVASDQRASFDVLFPLLNPGGLYIIEDVHTSYWARFGGGLRRPGTIVEAAKSMVDGLHKWYFRTPVGSRAKLASKQIRSIQFFDSVIAIEKGPRDRPRRAHTGSRSW